MGLANSYGKNDRLPEVEGYKTTSISTRATHGRID